MKNIQAKNIANFPKLSNSGIVRCCKTGLDCPVFEYQAIIKTNPLKIAFAQIITMIVKNIDTM